MEEHGRHCKSLEVHHRQRYCVSRCVSRRLCGSRVSSAFWLWDLMYNSSLPCFAPMLRRHALPTPVREASLTVISQPFMFSFGSAWICFQPSPAFTGSTVISSKYKSSTAYRSSAKGGEQ